MKIHHLNCISTCPLGGRLMDGFTPSMVERGHLTAHCLLVEAPDRLILVDTGMVEIEVGHHDVANVARVEAHALDLADRGHLLAEIRCDQAEEEAREPAVRIANVAQAHAGVDEDESVRRLH